MEIFIWILIGILIVFVFFWFKNNKFKKETSQHKQYEANADNVKDSIKEKTEYRILHYKKNYYADTKWLQYKDEKGVWRCVPNKAFGEVCGPKPGHSNMDYASPVSSISCYEGKENEIREFAYNWPFISDYFEYLDELHKKYINKKKDEQSKNGQVENL